MMSSQRKLYDGCFCGKCGSFHLIGEIRKSENNPESFLCKFCKKGTYWDLHRSYAIQEVPPYYDRVTQDEATGAWLTDAEWMARDR